MQQIKTICYNCKKLIPSSIRTCLDCGANKWYHDKFIGLKENEMTNFDRSYPVKFCLSSGDQIIGLNIPEALRLKRELEIIINMLREEQGRYA